MAEPKVGVNRGNAGKGRPKGSPNKTTTAAKEAIAEAFEKMGGTAALVEWAGRSDDNRKVFYSQIWPKIFPLQVGGDPNNPVGIATVVELVAPGFHARPD
jgi:hypothetical protein